VRLLLGLLDLQNMSSHRRSLPLTMTLQLILLPFLDALSRPCGLSIDVVLSSRSCTPPLEGLLDGMALFFRSWDLLIMDASPSYPLTLEESVYCKV